MTPRDPDARPADPAAAGRPRAAWIPVSLFILAIGVFGHRLPDEPAFVDESAYLSQSYYAALFAQGRYDDPLWLEYPAYDLPPLPKYLIGGALALGGMRTPGPPEARAWYGDTSLRFDGPGALTAARMPVVVVGALGCLAVYGLGMLADGRASGVVAALLLMVNPLYRLHSRRAMSDVPCEAFLLLGLLAALWVWREALRRRGGRATLAASVAAGACFGLSLSSKFSGALGPLTLGAWFLLAAALLPTPSTILRFGAATGLILAAATAVFVCLNPFLTAKPDGRLPAEAARIAALSTPERLALMYRLRLDVSESQQSIFPHNSLTRPAEKLATTAVQGFGRFGPFGPSHSDSTIRFDLTQDAGALVWLPLVLLGAVRAWARGLSQRRSGEPPTSWAILVQFAVALVVVAAYVPMAWDRYFLALQAPAALLVSGLVATLSRRLPFASRTRPTREGAE